ncbi:MAG: 3-deoxy-manno-octulosonate cytidylyltransferase [Bacteroidales bacterium]|nr:3-deoxy-manno-octulosonate cytidylyltransferase [Bacteroidales bacterium]MDD3430682.1 3-deoxy-manno-octulosonate cytidylyltransferase [Bacteroidales bacterium]MDD4361362.1 3-deoxy-manno-octulosonate cytidylyltransferase [Bacteroidales bacterium]MDD4429988.1 3-deoxy-manno-octulosonate cytidylyltransferase [Bacteroidales bacterium]
MRFLGLIPARYASSRFPGKPLVQIKNKPMIQWVYEQARPWVDDLFVCTDDERIFSAVEAFGGKVIMTSSAHRSGTDRCAEASAKLEGDFDVVINIQGDEPYIQGEQIQALKACFNKPETEIATLVKAFKPQDGLQALLNPNSPKVVLNPKGEAIYFSRSVIPYLRNFPQDQWLEKNVFYKHIGIYAYKRSILAKLALLEASPLEQQESLEQLRWLENGYKISTALTQIENQAIDTPEDLERLLKNIE